jgi:hypothetical protein
MDIALANKYKNRICYLIFFINSLFLQSPSYAQKIVKVKGSQVIFTSKGLGVSSGDVLIISSDGYEAGKIKVTKVGSASAIGKIIEGSALVGDKVKIDKKSTPSIDDSEATQGTSSSSSGNKSGFYGALGVGLLNFTAIETATGNFEFDPMTGLNLKWAKMNSRGGWGVSLFYGKSTATFVQKASLVFNNIDFTFLRLNFELTKAIFTKGIYGRLGAGYASGAIAATIVGFGAYTLDLTGLNGAAALGYQYQTNGWLFQLEGEAGIAYYMTSKATAPAGLTAASPGVIGQMAYGVLLNVGHKF